MLKILHTADWHIGKKFKSTDFTDDFEYALKQIEQFIANNSIQIVLVSGDIFDTFSPTHEALSQYYNALIRLQKAGVRYLILTAGNHDSVGILEAPKPILDQLNIWIVGSALSPKDAWKTYTIDNNTVHIAAVPFLRDADFKSLSVFASQSDYKERNRQGLIDYYTELAKHIPSEKGVNIALGHFTCLHASKSDSEREIQIGTIDLSDSSKFPEFDYFALGHIHKPQTVSKSKNIYYSGSPFPMSFSEIHDEKRVLQLSINGNSIESIESLPLKAKRALKRIESTSISEIQSQIQELQKLNSPNLVQIIMPCDNLSHLEISNAQLELQALKNQLERDNSPIQIIESAIVRKEVIEKKDTDDQIQDLQFEAITPHQIFENLLNTDLTPESDKQKLMELFASVEKAVTE